MSDRKYMTVDGFQVEIKGEKNLLEVIRKTGVKMPTFCYHTELSTYGACRMCMVENDKGGIEAACSTIPREGMNIKTNTDRLRKYRKNILELILANHCNDCTTCENNTNCKLQDLAMRFGLTEVRFPNHAAERRRIDTSSPSIVIDSGKCILCGDCVRTCHEVQNIGAIDFAYRGSKMMVIPALGKSITETPCVGCGQCAKSCPTGAIVVKNDVEKVLKALNDPNLYKTVQIAPAVRTAIGAELRAMVGTNSMGKIVAALRRMGFDAVFDTSFAADMTVLEETNEFIDRLENGGVLPLITSCCPGWIQYAEKKHPEFLPNISTCRSPMQMFASYRKAEAEDKGLNEFHVAIMPCTAKKFEAERPEFTMDGKPNVDAVLTTKELIKMIKNYGVQFDEVEPDAVDAPSNVSSGAGVIFGVTGGVCEAVLRHVAADQSRGALAQIAEIGQRGNEGIKEFSVELGDKSLKIAVVSGLANTEKLLNRVSAGEHFDFIEVMACPGGCAQGGGQPYAKHAPKEARAAGIYKVDKGLSVRRASEDPMLEKVYNGVLKHRTHELLHVDYVKSNKAKKK